MAAGRPSSTVSGRTAEVEVAVILDELARLHPENRPERTLSLSRRLIRLDDERHVLTSDLRGATLATQGLALTELSKLIPEADALDNLATAIACFDAALSEYHRNGNPLKWANTQTNKGIALQEQARRMTGAEGLATLNDAITCFDEALATLRRVETPLDWATAQNNKGVALVERAKRLAGSAALEAFEAAIVCFDAALEERQRRRTPQYWATTQNNKGAVLSEMAMRLPGPAKLAVLDAAIACFDAVLSVYRRDKAPQDWAMAHSNKGAALSEQAKLLSGAESLLALDKGIACFDAALQVYRQDLAPVQWAMTQTNRGVGLQERARHLAGAAQIAALDAAAQAFQQGLSGFPSEVWPYDHRHLARVLTAVLLRRALASDSSAEQRDEALRLAWSTIEASQEAARTLALREPLLPFRQQEWAENAQVFALAAAVAALRGNLPEAIRLLEKGRAQALAEALGRRNADLGQLGGADRRVYEDAVKVVQRIEARSRNTSNPLTLLEQARAANAHLKEVVTELRARYRGFLPEVNISLAQITRVLATGEALVYLIPLEAGTLSLATTATGDPVMRWLGELTSQTVFTLAVQLDDQGRDRRGYLPAAQGKGETWLDVALDTLLPKLGDQLMCHVIQQIRDLGCHRAVLVAGGLLSVMPLHAATYAPLAGELPSAPGRRRYACDDVAFTYTPSGLTLLAARTTAQQLAQQGPAQRVFVAGNPKLTRRADSWELRSPGYLPYAEWEAKEVAMLASKRVPPCAVQHVTSAHATWEAVTQGLRISDLAHLSLHAVFNVDQPDQSALLLAFNSRLSLRDLLDPETIQLDRLRLIVLSACQSGQSDVRRQSEEAVGLFGALLAAGAPAVIGTLWPVNDLAAARLMESFARRTYRDGVAPDAGLQAAAHELRGIPDAYALPAEAGGPVSTNAGRPLKVEALSDTVRPQPTPAREAIAAELTQCPDLAGVTRKLSPEQWERVDQLAHGARDLSHPMYWAGFVYYGASVSLSGTQSQAGIATYDLDNETDVAHVVTVRAASHYPAASEACPRCYAEDYLPLQDARRNDLWRCASCGLIYTPSMPKGNNAQA